MPTSGNITQGKAASASSYIMPYAPSRAVDGSSGVQNRWLCASGSSWLRVDLGGYYKITSWVVTSIGQVGWSPTCNLNTFALQVNTAPPAAPAWVTVDSVSGNTLNSVSRPLAAPVVANAVRVNVTQGDSRPLSTLASILEFVAMGYPVSNNANLSNLVLSSGALTPAFSSATTEYTATVPNNVTSITVTPTAADAEATIAVNNQPVASGTASQAINLAVGANTLTVVVRSPDTTVAKTYTVTVTRQGNVNLSNLTLSSGTLSPAFAPATLSYTSSVGSNVSSITVTPTAQDSTSTIKVNGTVVASGTASGPISLNFGANTITVLVSSTPGGNSQTYTVTVTKEEDLYLSALQATTMAGAQIPLSPSPFDKNVTAYSGSTAKTAKIKIIATADDPSNVNLTIGGNPATSGIAAQVTVTSGVTNSINIVVTSKTSGATKTYTCNIAVSN